MRSTKLTPPPSTAGGASAYTTNPRGDIRHLNDWTYTLEKPGPVEDRQTASHPHQALFDPTGRFVLIPDLGADKIRVYGVSSPGTDITQRADIPVTAGTGPRHGVFFPSTGTPRFYYLINELSSTITVFAVSYTASDIVLREIEARTTAPAPLAKGKTSFPSEAVISSCGRFLYAANRWDGYFGEKVDSMVMFARDSETGKLGSPEFFSGGVLNIRHFSIDPAGKWLVTEGQTSEDIRVFRRDGDTGKVQPVGEPFKVKGGPLCLTWGKK